MERKEQRVKRINRLVNHVDRVSKKVSNTMKKIIFIREKPNGKQNRKQYYQGTSSCCTP